MATEMIHLADVLKRPVVDRSHERLGKIGDLVVRLGESPHPPILGVVVRNGHQDCFAPIGRTSGLGSPTVRFDGTQADLGPFERRARELLLAQDLLSRHLINLVGGRLIRANEIELAQVKGRWEVVGVDPSTRTPLRKLWFGKKPKAGASIVDWSAIEPFVAHVPTARLRIPYRKLARLHPAQIADLVEAASHQEGEEIIEAVAADRELEADVFEELDPEHQVEFLASRSDGQAARVLDGMAPDDAADLIMELAQERRLPVLNLMGQAQQSKLRSLLNYNPETAGGLMSPDFVSLPGSTTIAQALSAVKISAAPNESLSVVFSTDAAGRTVGCASLVSLLRASPHSTLASIASDDLIHVHTDWDVHRVLRKMSDYNLTVAPVFDEDHDIVLGVVTVDDLLELLLPSGWRRDYGPAAAET
ncbi:MAG: magnesium transporter MgtE N-terminal domain-containing protein [Acidimicrobiales bacterium]